MGTKKKPKKKRKPTRYEWCFCCREVMPVAKDGRCKECMSYIVLD